MERMSLAGYELKKIETLVNETISQVGVARRKASVANLKISLPNEALRIKTVFNDTLLSQHSEDALQRYFLCHQLNIIRLINALTDFSKGKVSGNLHITCITDCLYDLLLFLKTHFPSYFKRDVTAPAAWRETFLMEVSSRSEELLAIELNPYIDKQLFHVASLPLKAALHGIKNEYTIGHLEYLRLLQTSLLSLNSFVPDSNVARIDTITLLIKINFNCPFFSEFVKQHIKSTIAVSETLVDRLDQLLYYFKIVDQVTVMPGAGFNISGRCVKEEILEWVSAELEYNRQKRILQFSCPQKEDVKQDFKVNFDLSVSHLAYLFKAFIETGVVQNKNTSELIRFLAKFVKTKKAETVSYESLRIKFYNTESGTKDAVKRMLESVVKYMSKN
jgi:hypothetical protein